MKNLVKSVSCVLVGMAVFGFFSCEGETEYVDRIVEKEVEVGIELVVILLVVGCILIEFEIMSYSFGCVYG